MRVVGKPHKMIDLHLHSRWHGALQSVIKVFLYGGFVTAKSRVAPVARLCAAHVVIKLPGQLIRGAERQPGHTARAVLLVIRRWSRHHQDSLIGLPKTARPGVLPGKFAELAVPLPGIKVNLFAVQLDDRHLIIKLAPAKKILDEDAPVSIDDNGSVSFQPRGAHHGHEQPRDLVVISALLLPHVLGIADLYMLG